MGGVSPLEGAIMEKKIFGKTALVADVAQRSGSAKTDVDKIVDAVLESVAAALQREESVRLPGLGSFSVSHRASATRRNPRTGEAIMLAPSCSVRFSIAKPLRQALQILAVPEKA